MGYKTIKQISGDKEEPKLMTKYEWKIIFCTTELKHQQNWRKTTREIRAVTALELPLCVKIKAGCNISDFTIY